MASLTCVSQVDKDLLEATLRDKSFRAKLVSSETGSEDECQMTARLQLLSMVLVDKGRLLLRPRAHRLGERSLEAHHQKYRGVSRALLKVDVELIQACRVLKVDIPRPHLDKNPALAKLCKLGKKPAHPTNTEVGGQPTTTGPELGIGVVEQGRVGRDGRAL